MPHDRSQPAASAGIVEIAAQLVDLHGTDQRRVRSTSRLDMSTSARGTVPVNLTGPSSQRTYTLPGRRAG